jgi:hypothetical protein
MAAAEGAAEVTGRARLNKGAAAFPLSAVNDGVTSGVGAAEFCCAILDFPVLPKVATATVFSAGADFSDCAELFSSTLLADGFSAPGFVAEGIEIVLEPDGDEVLPFSTDEAGCVPADGAAGGTLAASCVVCGVAVFGFCILRKANVDAAAITSTATTPIIMNLFAGFLSSVAIESNVPKFARGAASARFSSFRVGIASGTTSRGAALLGSTLAGAGAAPRGADEEGLITTAGGAAGAGVGTTTGFAVIVGAAGLGASACGFSSRARRSFCSSAEIWSAMVFNTATCVIVNA